MSQCQHVDSGKCEKCTYQKWIDWTKLCDPQPLNALKLLIDQETNSIRPGKFTIHGER